MSNGACRALVVLLLGLLAAGTAAVPATARSEQLREDVSTYYSVNPEGGFIDVSLVIALTNTGTEAFRGTWGPIILEDAAVPSFQPSSVQREGEFTDLPGPWKAMDIRLPRINPDQRIAVRVDYRIESPDLLTEAVPIRLSREYAYFCLPGQDADVGSLSVELPSRYETTVSGSPMERVDGGLSGERTNRPGELFSCVEATIPRLLEVQRFLGPDDRPVVLQAWGPEAANWLAVAEPNVRPSLDAVRAFLGYEIPGEGAVVIRQTPPRNLGGYASDHATPGVVQLDEFAGVAGADHEMAHAWFSTDQFPEQWMREGLAAWTAAGLAGLPCEAVEEGDGSLDLSEWQVVRPTAGADIETTISLQDAAVCGIMSAVAGRMDEATFKTVLGSMLQGEAKYIGSGEPGRAVTDVVDWREWLDAVDERGLVPAGATDLDWAQGLLDSYGIPSDAQVLQDRSEARRRYHDFLAAAAPMGAPAVVRTAMDEWRFDDAMDALDQAEAVLEDLTSADALLPEAGLVPFIQPGFEAASSAAELDAVREQAGSLLASAELIIPPLTQLREATPESWSIPTAIRDAITDQRFDDALAAITPALKVAQEVRAADAALPEAGLLDRYQARFEAMSSTEQLTEFATEVEQMRRQAEETGIALTALEGAVGDWVIPEAVTEPVNQGQIAAALAIVQDARGVVAAAQEADIALPEADVSTLIRPQFEAIQTAAEMAALRAEAQKTAAVAGQIGQDLATLRAVLPSGWTVPDVVMAPVKERDFDAAAASVGAAAQWVQRADRAEQALPEIGAMDSIREAFEGATTLQELQDGARLAELRENAAQTVSQAIIRYEQDRDLMTQIGLLGTDLEPLRAAAVASARRGDPAQAANDAAALITAVEEASRSGGLRLAGLVFLGVAIVGALGLWYLFRREAGPPWARSKKPPWAKSGKPPWARR